MSEREQLVYGRDKRIIPQRYDGSASNSSNSSSEKNGGSLIPKNIATKDGNRNSCSTPTSYLSSDSIEDVEASPFVVRSQGLPIVLLNQAVDTNGTTGVKKQSLQGPVALHINILTSLWGPTCFAMPWAFQEAGLLAGAIGVALVGIITGATTLLLIRSKHALMAASPITSSSSSSTTRIKGSTSSSSSSTYSLTYAEVAGLALGPFASTLVKLATTISCVGICAAYVTFISGMITQLAPAWQQTEVLMVLLPPFIIVSWVRTFRRLALLNILGNLSLFLGIAAMLMDGYHQYVDRGDIIPSNAPPPPPLALVKVNSLLLFLGPAACLFVIHYCAIPIENEAANRADFPPAVMSIFTLTAVMQVVIGIMGYFFYGRGPLVTDGLGHVLPGCERPVCDNVLKNIQPGPLKTAMFVAFSFNLSLTYAIMLVPPREYLETYLVRPHWVISKRWQRNAIRALIVLFTFAIASYIKQFGLLTGFVGGITDILQGFILPPLIYAATHKFSLNQSTINGLYLMSLIGILLSGMTTYQNVGELRKVLALGS